MRSLDGHDVSGGTGRRFTTTQRVVAVAMSDIGFAASLNTMDRCLVSGMSEGPLPWNLNGGTEAQRSPFVLLHTVTDIMPDAARPCVVSCGFGGRRRCRYRRRLIWKRCRIDDGNTMCSNRRGCCAVWLCSRQGRIGNYSPSRPAVPVQQPDVVSLTWTALPRMDSELTMSVNVAVKLPSQISPARRPIMQPRLPI